MLDHHADVRLNHTLSARFHAHTTLQLPNADDPCRARVTAWRDRARSSSI